MKNRLSLVTEMFFYIFFSLLLLSQLKILYNSVMTLIILIGVLGLGLFYFVCDKSNERKKHLWYLILYFLFIGVYFVLSHFHHQTFFSLVPDNFNYSLMSEFLYFVKMSMPIVMLIIFSGLELPKKSYFTVIYSTILFFSSIIVITNLFGISYGSYSDELIKGNFFSWFTDGYDLYTFYHLASKGFFYSANQVSAILLMLLPISLYSMIKNADFKLFILLFLQIWAMFLLGTKTAIYGSILVISAMVIMGLFYTFINKKIPFNKKNILYINLLFLLWIIIFPFSPIHSRNEVQTIINQEDFTYALVSEEKVKVVEDNEKEEKKKYIEANYQQKRIYEHFILKSYPYTYDPDFWYSILELSSELRTDYRFLEKSMLDRVVEINNNPLDKLFGISYTRVQNIFNLEQDFLVQYYSVGIVGTILLLNCYFIVIFKIIFVIIKKKLNNCFLTLSLLCGSCVFLAVSYYSGNLLNSLMVVPYLCLILGWAHKEIRSE